MTTRISMRTEDVDPRIGRTRDTVLNTLADGGRVIGVNTRILPEPAPAAPDLGALLDGSSGRPVDVDALAQSVTTAFDLLNASDLRKLKTRLAKYCSSGPTNQAGITSTNTGDLDPLTCGQDSIVSGINAANKSFWEKKTAADNAAQLIR